MLQRSEIQCQRAAILSGKSNKKTVTPKKRTVKAAPAKRKLGRPKFSPDLEQVRKLAALQCTDDEIAAFFDVSVRTIERRRKDSDEFNDAVMQGKLLGRVSLRRRQYEAALGGNVAMLIWLGKNILGQAERVDRRVVDRDGNDVQTHGVLVVPATMTPEEWVAQAAGHAVEACANQ